MPGRSEPHIAATAGPAAPARSLSPAHPLAAQRGVPSAGGVPRQRAASQRRPGPPQGTAPPGKAPPGEAPPGSALPGTGPSRTAPPGAPVQRTAPARTPTAPPAASGAFSHVGSDTAAGTWTGIDGAAGGLLRRQGMFTNWITADGSSGFAAEPARYQLYASLACPWSQRVLIACRLLGLDRVIGLTLTDPVTDDRGWRFMDDGGDPITGAHFLAELYRATAPGYPGPCTVPLLWDMHTSQVVNNDVGQLGVMLQTQFQALHRPGAPDLYPAARRGEIESLAALIQHTVNAGVYKAGLATSQVAYEQATEAVFTTLDALDERLSRRRFLLGGALTEADIRLYPTLARFDAVYYQLFGCNLRRLSDYANLWGYARDLYAHPGFGETTELSQIKQHYFLSLEWGSRGGIMPSGPEIDWAEPHGRDWVS